MKRPASTEKEDKEFKKVKLELESKNTTKKEVKSDEDDGTTSEIKKHLKKLTREVSFRSFFFIIYFFIATDFYFTSLANSSIKPDKTGFKLPRLCSKSGCFLQKSLSALALILRTRV